MEVKKIPQVRDLVVPNNPKYNLRSGCSEYNVVVVVSVDPFVLVSCRGDMRWAATVSIENFKTVGMANDEDFKMCMNRLKA